MEKRQLIEKISKAEQKAIKYQNAFDKSDNPQVKALYWQSVGKVIAFQAVKLALLGNPVNLNILCE